VFPYAGEQRCWVHYAERRIMRSLPQIRWSWAVSGVVCSA
jgi:transposase-like protein